MKDETYESLEQVKEAILEALEEESSKKTKNLNKIMRMKETILKELMKLPDEYRKNKKISLEESGEIRDWINEFAKKYL